MRGLNKVAILTLLLGSSIVSGSSLRYGVLTEDLLDKSSYVCYTSNAFDYAVVTGHRDGKLIPYVKENIKNAADVEAIKDVYVLISPANNGDMES